MTIGLFVAGLLTVIVFIGPYLTGWDARQTDIEAVRNAGNRPVAPLTGGHLLGTDILGRDILTRVLEGARISVLVAGIAQLVVAMVGVPLGAIAGWLGGRADILLAWVIDVFLAIPQLVLLIIIQASLLPSPVGRWLDGLFMAFVVIGLTSWMATARLVRGQALTLRERPFVEAAFAIGLPRWRVLVRHVLPNAATHIIVSVSLGLPAAILAEATISFLGVGIQPPAASLGSLLRNGVQPLALQPMLVIAPSIVLIAIMASFIVLGEVLSRRLPGRAGV